MKKKLFFVFCCFAAVSAFAQQSMFPKSEHVREDASRLNLRPAEAIAMKGEYGYRMSGYTTNDNYIICRYYYDDQHRLEAVYEEVPGEYRLYDSLRYNALGQLVRMDGYQWLGGQWQHVYYVDYGFNEEGLGSSRTNYNNMDGDYQLGGVYEYSYNADGQIVRSELTMMGEVYQVVDYQYNNGLLFTETWSYAELFSSSDAFTPSERFHYHYADGRLVLVQDSLYDAGSWMYYGKVEYAMNHKGTSSIWTLLPTTMPATVPNITVTTWPTTRWSVRCTVSTSVPLARR